MRERERERERGGGWRESEEEEINVMDWKAKATHKVLFIITCLVQDDSNAYNEDGILAMVACEPAQVCPHSCSMSTTKMLA